MTNFMPRWRIIRTLLYKEVLRYRYNWGLLVMIAALLTLAGLISISAHFKKLPGQEEGSIRACYIVFRPGTPDEEWALHLQNAEPSPPKGCTVYFREYSKPLFELLPTASMVIEVNAPAGPRGVRSQQKEGTWTARYWYSDLSPRGNLPYRDWFVNKTHAFLHSRPLLEEETHVLAAKAPANALDVVPLIVTALVIFALYLLSFNLFITSTGEEREKKVLLGLLLTPAAPVEIIAAKAIFYASSSLLVALAVASMYQPQLLANPLLWCTIVSGSVGYVAIGTVAVSLVRRQTTINTVSMLYLLATSVVMLLSEYLIPFAFLRLLLVENWLYLQMREIVGGRSPGWLLYSQGVLAGVVAAWCFIAVWVFARQGMSISRGR